MKVVTSVRLMLLQNYRTNRKPNSLAGILSSSADIFNGWCILHFKLSPCSVSCMLSFG